MDKQEKITLVLTTLLILGAFWLITLLFTFFKFDLPIYKNKEDYIKSMQTNEELKEYEEKLKKIEEFETKLTLDKNEAEPKTE